MLALGHVDNPMHIEAHFLRITAPVIVAEAVVVFAVVRRIEAVVTTAHGEFVFEEGVGGVLDLLVCASLESAMALEICLKFHGYMIEAGA